MHKHLIKIKKIAQSLPDITPEDIEQLSENIKEVSPENTSPAELAQLTETLNQALETLDQHTTIINNLYNSQNVLSNNYTALYNWLQNLMTWISNLKEQLTHRFTTQDTLPIPREPEPNVSVKKII